MSSGLIGYHPERVADLARRTRLVVDDLAGIGSDDPVAAGAVGEVRRALGHLETGWLPLLERIQTSAVMTAPIDVDPGDGRSWFDAATDAMLGAAPGDGRTVIAPIVAGLSDAEREFFQGFVDERAPQVAAELSLFDAHPDYAINELPVELRRLDDRNEWMWLATLYLQEQYHHMIDTGAVELQRDGDAYWIDPIDLTDTNKVIGAEIILAAIASAGGFRRGGGFSAAAAKTATSPLPKARSLGITKAQSPVWQSLTPYHGKTRSNGESGRARRLFEWDHRHGEIEVFDRNGRHLGAMDPVSGAMIKPAMRDDRWWVEDDAPLASVLRFRRDRAGSEGQKGNRQDGAVHIHHEVTGSGPAVLLTHGFGASSHMFAATVADLASDHTAVVWDMRGHGRSDSPADPAAYSVATSLTDMSAILDDVGAERAVLLGHSLGGYLSLELAIAHPERTAALVLVDTGPGYRSDRGRAEWNEMAERYARDLDERGLDGLPGSDELIAGVHRGAAGLALSARGVLRQADGHVLDALPSIGRPTLVVVGERDTDFLAGSRYMAGKIPGATLAVIDGAGHAPPVSHPDAFNAVLRPFLASLPAASA